MLKIDKYKDEKDRGEMDAGKVDEGPNRGSSQRKKVKGGISSGEAVLHQLKQAEKRGINSLVVIINSYGGSIRVAKNIAISLHLLKSREVPVYCFAEDFCLNSANIILTSGSECFANKLSVIGDLGFADQKYVLSSRNGPLFSVESFSSGPKALGVIFPADQVAGSETSLKLVKQSARDLQENVLKNRETHLSSKGVSKASFKDSFFQGGSFNLNTAQDLAYIDGILNFNKFIKLRLSSQRILEGSDDIRYRTISFMRNGLQFFKQE